MNIHRSDRAASEWLAILGSLLGLAAPSLGCSNNCDGHGNGEFYCKDNHIMQCRDWSAMDEGTCAPDECRDVPGAGTSCVIPGLSCPTSNLGYQCMGEQRIGCYSDGSVVDYGSCPALRSQYDEGPYCVENPGGDVLRCGWKKERCDTDWDVRCFEDGSAVCWEGVYRRFVSNAEAGQLVCDVTKLGGCWEGKTWCEGDVLKRCDRCLDGLRCLEVSTEAVCSPGGCSAYQPPGWLYWANPTGGEIPMDYLPMGCTVDAPECVPGVTHVCQNGAPVFCASAGVGVVAMTCEEIRSTAGRIYGAKEGSTVVEWGPYCVPGAGSHQAICVLDPVPCVSPAYRCDPLDPTGTLIQACSEDGYWSATWSCDNPSDPYPTQTCQHGSPFDWCE